MSDQSSSELMPLQLIGSHIGGVNAVAISPDGKILASGSSDKTIKLWEVSTGKLIRSLDGHTDSVRSVAWSSDGKILASGSDDKTIKLWETSTGKLIRSLKGHTNYVRSVAWSSDGKILASGSWDKTIKLWEVSTGKLIRSLDGHKSFVSSVAWSSDGKILASGSDDKTIKLWEVSTGKLIRSLDGHTSPINSAAWSSDGKILASGSLDKTIKLWEVSTGKLIRSLDGHTSYVSSVAWSSDGKILASGSWDKTIKLWEVSTGKLIRSFEGHTSYVSSAAWSSDGKILASGSEDATIKLWEASTGKLIRSFEGHTSYVSSAAWSSDGKILASGSSDKSIKLWEVSTGKLIRSLEGHTSYVSSAAWSADGKILASGSLDNTIKLWEVSTGKLIRSLDGHKDSVSSVTWSSDGKILASGSADKTIKLWEVSTGKLIRSLDGHKSSVYSAAWSSDSKILASGSEDATIKLWEVSTGKLIRSLDGHTSYVSSAAWSSDGKILASGSADKTIKLWEASTGKLIRSLEGHTNSVISAAWSSDGKILAAISQNALLIWCCDTYEAIAKIDVQLSDVYVTNGLCFNPTSRLLASIGANNSAIYIWDLNDEALFGVAPIKSIHYTNAKVVLLGDSGVGKSGLGLVLTGEPFAPTESTHGRKVFNFDSYDFDLENGQKETRETLLWDLAGQPGYRLIHQLYLNETAVALVVFDGLSETDLFAGVRHWDRALRQAQKERPVPIKKFLVAARIDRGGVPVSRDRIEKWVQNWGFDGYYETSAKEGFNIEALRQTIKNAVDWDNLPKVTSTELFQNIKEFLVEEKKSGRLLSTAGELYGKYLKKESITDDKDLKDDFATCIKLVESQGLIRKLSFGDLVLLQPELIDAYASAIVNAAKQQPDGIGTIVEKDAREGKFQIPTDERLKDKASEHLLLAAMIEDLLKYEIALREQTIEGDVLVFPSQFTRENPDLPDVEGKEVVFNFEGPVANIYTTLVVRLSYSEIFRRTDMWKNAVQFTSSAGGSYGIFLREVEEARGELTLFFDPSANEVNKYHLEDYVYSHLRKRALFDTIKRRRIFVCEVCGAVLTDQIVEMRKKRGFNWIDCNICGKRISLLDREERLKTAPESKVQKMDLIADERRNREVNLSSVEGKKAMKDFDVFLCHNSKDKPTVKDIAERLKEKGILPWLDEWELRPGFPWQTALEEQIENIKSAAVFVGENGLGPWQDMEQSAFLRQFVKRQCPVIPVILPECKQTPKLPTFLDGMTWVDFRKPESSPLERLIWGITGKRDGIDAERDPKMRFDRDIEDERMNKKDLKADMPTLLRVLNNLVGQQLNNVILIVNPPSEVMPPPTAAHGDRVYALLNWAQSETGRGLEEIKQALDAVLKR